LAITPKEHSGVLLYCHRKLLIVKIILSDVGPIDVQKYDGWAWK